MKLVLKGIWWFIWSGFFSQYNENLINNQNPELRQIENDETPGAEYPNENDSEDKETNESSAIPNFMPKLFPYVMRCAIWYH